VERLVIAMIAITRKSSSHRTGERPPTNQKSRRIDRISYNHAWMELGPRCPLQLSPFFIISRVPFLFADLERRPSPSFSFRAAAYMWIVLVLLFGARCVDGQTGKKGVCSPVYPTYPTFSRETKRWHRYQHPGTGISSPGTGTGTGTRLTNLVGVECSSRFEEKSSCCSIQGALVLKHSFSKQMVVPRDVMKRGCGPPCAVVQVSTVCHI